MLLELTMAICMVATCMRAPAAAPRARGGPRLTCMLQPVGRAPARPRVIAIDSDSADSEPPRAPAGSSRSSPGPRLALASAAAGALI